MSNNLSLLMISLLFVLLIGGCDTFRPAKPTSDLVGTWIGLGKVNIPPEYLDQREIPFSIFIAEDGTVTGNVGDAEMHKTRLQKTSWWYRIFSKANYKAVFDLYGNIVNRESFRRDGGTLYIKGIEDDELICSFTSTGSQVSTTNLVLNVTDIRLKKPN